MHTKECSLIQYSPEKLGLVIPKKDFYPCIKTVSFRKYSLNIRMSPHIKSGKMHRSTPKSASAKITDDSLVIIGTTRINNDAVKIETSPSEEVAKPSDQDYQVEKEYEVSDDIEEIELTPIELLHQAAELRDPAFYYQALTLDAEKRALQERADQLQHRLEIELRIKSRKLASKYYGWTDLPWSLPIHGDQMNLNDMWGALRSSSDHEYALQDPSISSDFFNNLRQMMVNDDLNTMRTQWGPDYPIPDYFHDYPAVILCYKF
jgi:hypothetical protein